MTTIPQSRSISAAQRVLLDTFSTLYVNANAADGIVIADGTGVVEARFLVAPDTAANINAEVPDASELRSFTNIPGALTIGDGVTSGGLNVSLSGENCIFLAATGDQDDNGTRLEEVILAAASRTPYGSALSLTNPIFVVLGPGRYKLQASVTVPSAVGIIGLCGSQATTIVTTSSGGRLLVTPTAGTHHLSILKGLTFEPTSDAGSMTFNLTDIELPNGSLTLLHDDLDFPGVSSTTSVHGWLVSGTSPVVYGIVRRVRTTGQQLYSGPGSGALFITWANKFIECEGGNRSFGAVGGAITVSSIGVLTGGLYRCRNFAEGTNPFSARVDCDFFDNVWTPPILRVGTNAFFWQSILRGGVTHNAAVTCRLAHNAMGAAIGGDITNNIDDGTLDTAGNFVDVNV